MSSLTMPCINLNWSTFKPKHWTSILPFTLRVTLLLSDVNVSSRLHVLLYYWLNMIEQHILRTYLSTLGSYICLMFLFRSLFLSRFIFTFSLHSHTIHYPLNIFSHKNSWRSVRYIQWLLAFIFRFIAHVRSVRYVQWLHAFIFRLQYINCNASHTSFIHNFLEYI